MGCKVLYSETVADNQFITEYTEEMRAGEEKNQPRRFPICETSTWTTVSMSEVSNTTGKKTF